MSDLLSSSIGLLPPVLSQVPVASESQIMTVLLGGAALLVIANQVTTLVARLRAKPEPRDVQDESRETSAALAAHVEIVAVEQRATHRLAELTREGLAGHVEEHNAFLRDASTREHDCAGKLHKRIDDLATVVSHNGGKLQEGFDSLKESLREIRAIVISRRSS